MKARVAFLLVVASALSVVAAPALPLGPPVVVIDVADTEDPFVKVLTARASDPDGRIATLEICIDAGRTVCRSTGTRAGGPADAAQGCAFGGTSEVSLRHRFRTEGRYLATAVATSRADCPLVGTEERAVAEADVLVVGPPAPIACATDGRPGASDTGVRRDGVVLASIVTASGPGASFEGRAATAMQSAVRAINERGGVCDRLIELRMYDGLGDARRESEAIRDSMREAFAFVGMPATGGFRAMLESGEVDRAGVPFVGTPGDTAIEFGSPHVWPIGVPPAGFAQASVDEAFAAGGRRFGVVWDRTEARSGELRDAVVARIEATRGAVLVAGRGIYPAQASYGAEIQAFNTACDGTCDAVFLLLDPGTALTWLAGRPQLGSVRTVLGPRLFSESFAQNCGDRCDGAVAWTDFHPPIGNYPAPVARYATEVRSGHPASGAADEIAEAAWHAVYTIAEAMGAVGHDLTRARLRAVLDRDAFYLGLTGGPLEWEPSRVANRWMRAYSVVSLQGAFAGWREHAGWSAAG